MTLVCTSCHKEKLESDFYIRKNRPKGYTSACKSCTLQQVKFNWSPRQQSSYKLKANYGLTLEDYEQLLTKQKGVCAICFQPETTMSNAGYIKNLSVDHCHTTGKIRGLLCHHCNTGIGKFMDSVERLESAIKYLKERV